MKASCNYLLFFEAELLAWCIGFVVLGIYHFFTGDAFTQVARSHYYFTYFLFPAAALPGRFWLEFHFARKWLRLNPEKLRELFANTDPESQKALIWNFFRCANGRDPLPRETNELLEALPYVSYATHPRMRTASRALLLFLLIFCVGTGFWYVLGFCLLVYGLRIYIYELS